MRTDVIAMREKYQGNLLVSWTLFWSFSKGISFKINALHNPNEVIDFRGKNSENNWICQLFNLILQNFIANIFRGSCLSTAWPSLIHPMVSTKQSQYSLRCLRYRNDSHDSNDNIFLYLFDWIVLWSCSSSETETANTFIAFPECVEEGRKIGYIKKNEKSID